MDIPDKSVKAGIAAVLAEMGREAGAHQSLEAIAAFIDGRLDDNDKDAVARHIALCAECRETYLLSAEMAKETSSSAGIFHKYPRTWIASAAAILLAFFVVLSMNGRRGDTVNSASKKESNGIAVVERNPVNINNGESVTGPAAYARYMASMGLAASGLRHEMASPDGDSYSFAGGNGEYRKGFWLGVCLFRLNVALGADDENQTRKELERLIRLLKESGLPKGVTAHYREMLKNIREGSRPRQYENDETAYGPLLKENKLGPFIDFGIWAEAGMMASAKVGKGILEKDDGGRFLILSAKSGLPKGIVESLKEIGSLAGKKGALGEADRQRLERLYERIEEIML